MKSITLGSCGKDPNIDAYCDSMTFEETNHDNYSKNAILKKEEGTELEGPYECPFCGGHFMADATFIDQVSNIITCMYCTKKIIIPELEAVILNGKCVLLLQVGLEIVE